MSWRSNHQPLFSPDRHFTNQHVWQLVPVIWTMRGAMNFPGKYVKIHISGVENECEATNQLRSPQVGTITIQHAHWVLWSDPELVVRIAGLSSTHPLINRTNYVWSFRPGLGVRGVFLSTGMAMVFVFALTVGSVLRCSHSYVCAFHRVSLFWVGWGGAGHVGVLDQSCTDLPRPVQGATWLIFTGYTWIYQDPNPTRRNHHSTIRAVRDAVKCRVCHKSCQDSEVDA